MKIIQNKCIKDFSSIKIGGKCKIFIEITSINSIKKAIKYCKKYNLKYRIIGSGTSIYFSEYFDGAILYNKFKYITLLESTLLDRDSINKENILLLSSGTTINEIVEYFKKYKNSKIICDNLEILKNIKGTIGGAIYNNTNNICELLEGCSILDDNKIKFYNSNEFNYNFKGSYLKFNKEKNNILLMIFLNLSKKINYTLIENNDLKIIEKSFFIENVFNNIYFENKVILIKGLLKNINFTKINDDKIEIYENIIFNKKNITSVELKKFIEKIQILFLNIYGFDIILNIECI